MAFPLTREVEARERLETASGCAVVGLRRGDEGRKQPKITIPPLSDACYPSVRMPVHPAKAAAIVTLDRTVSTVFGWPCTTQVLPPVIEPIAVTVVDLCTAGSDELVHLDGGCTPIGTFYVRLRIDRRRASSRICTPVVAPDAREIAQVYDGKEADALATAERDQRDAVVDDRPW